MSDRQRYIRADGDKALTTEELREHIPAIFAEKKHWERSDSYIEIPTIAALEELQNAGFYVVEAMQAKPRDVSRYGKCKHVVRLRHPQDKVERRVGGAAYFEVVMKNAFDGSAAYALNAGMFRWICLNGAVVSDSMVESVHIMHIGNKKKILDRVIAGVKHIVEQAPKVIAAVNQWTTIELRDRERHEFAAKAHKVRFFGVDTPVTPDQLLHPRRVEDEKRDLWTTFNVVQENCIRGGLLSPRNGVNRRTREVRGIDQNIQVNKALWAHAADLAQLKLAA